MREKMMILALLGLVLAVAAPARAQDERSAKEVIEAYKVWKLTDVLDLSEEEMPVFFSRVRKIGEAEEEHRRAEREAVRSMEDLLRAGADDAELERALRDYERMRQEHWNDTQKLREDAASMLSLRQRCRYTVFEERFRAEIRNMIEDVRRDRGSRGALEEFQRDGEGQGPGQGRGSTQGSGSGEGQRPGGSGKGGRQGR